MYHGAVNRGNDVDIAILVNVPEFDDIQASRLVQQHDGCREASRTIVGPEQQFRVALDQRGGGREDIDISIQVDIHYLNVAESEVHAVHKCHRRECP